MPKRTRRTESVRQGHSIESILSLINSLPKAERIRVFERLANHPDNKPFRDLHDFYCMLAKSTMPKLQQHLRGPLARKAKRENVEERIEQYYGAGMTDAKAIHQALRQDVPDLKIAIKTVQNKLAILKRQRTSVPEL
jgi:hypothetical protein